MCPVTGQELSSLTVPDTNRVLKRLIDSWKSEHCKHLISESAGLDVKLPVIDKALDSAGDMSEKLEKARHLMAIGGIDFLLHKFQEGGGDEQPRVAEHLLLCIRAEGSCRNYVAIKIDGSSVLRLLQSEVLSARRTAVGLLIEMVCLRRCSFLQNLFFLKKRCDETNFVYAYVLPSYLPITNILISNRREMFELLLHGLRAETIIEAMDVLVEYLRSLPVEEQAPIAVLLLRLDELVCSFKHCVSCCRTLHCNSMKSHFVC